MKRREFIGLVGSAAAAWPLASRAQNTNKAPKRIAFFPDLNPVAREYWQADMRVFGWIEGQDFIVLPSGIEAASRNPSSEDAQRLVANKLTSYSRCQPTMRSLLNAQQDQFPS
jgi:hypothetical protein